MTLRAWSRWLLVLVAALSLCGCGLGGPPSDAAMVALLRDERSAFDAIARMMGEDRLVGDLVVDRLPAHSPAQRARRDRYRVLLRRTGCGSAVREASGRITFDHHYPTRGYGVAGTGFKGYVYAPTPPSPILPALDEGGLDRFEDAYRHVDGAWYLWRVPI